MILVTIKLCFFLCRNT